MSDHFTPEIEYVCYLYKERMIEISKFHGGIPARGVTKTRSTRILINKGQHKSPKDLDMWQEPGKLNI